MHETDANILTRSHIVRSVGPVLLWHSVIGSTCTLMSRINIGSRNIQFVFIVFNDTSQQQLVIIHVWRPSATQHMLTAHVKRWPRLSTWFPPLPNQINIFMSTGTCRSLGRVTNIHHHELQTHVS